MVNDNTKIIIQEIEFDRPNKNDIRKWDYKEWKEGKNKYKSIWLDTYINDNNIHYISRYNLVSINGSKFLLDDKKLRGDDIESAKSIFKEIE